MDTKNLTTILKTFGLTDDLTHDIVNVADGKANIVYEGEYVYLPTDSRGNPIQIGDYVCGESLDRSYRVDGISNSRDGAWLYFLDPSTDNEDDAPMFFTRSADEVSLADTWDAIEKTAYHLVMSEYLDDPERDVKALIERCKALATKEDN